MSNKPRNRTGRGSRGVVLRVATCVICAVLLPAGCEEENASRVADPHEGASTAGDRTEPNPSADANDATDATEGDEPTNKLTLPPEPTFTQHCARCHGPKGMFYALPFQHEGEALREVVADMMRNHAGLNPTESDLDAMVEYHLQIRERRTGNDN